MKRLAVFLLLLWMFESMLPAQTSQGRISGRVVDSSGAVIPELRFRTAAPQ